MKTSTRKNMEFPTFSKQKTNRKNSFFSDMKQIPQLNSNSTKNTKKDQTNKKAFHIIKNKFLGLGKEWQKRSILLVLISFNNHA